MAIRGLGARRAAPLVLPAVAVLGSLFLGGLALAALRTVGIAPLGGLADPSLDAWRRLAATPGLAAAVSATLAVAAASTLLSTVAGVGAALLLRAAGGGRAATAALQVNLAVPHVVTAIGVVWLLSQSGLVARIARALGWIEAPADFPVLVADPFFLGTIAAYAVKEIPFVAAVTLAMLAAVGEGPAETARSLGATAGQAFRHVTWPLVRPGVGAAATVVFAFALGTYEVPFLVGPSGPRLLPVLAYQMFTSDDLADRPTAIALALAIAALGAVCLLAANRLLTHLPGGEGAR